MSLLPTLARKQSLMNPAPAARHRLIKPVLGFLLAGLLLGGCLGEDGSDGRIWAAVDWNADVSNINLIDFGINPLLGIEKDTLYPVSGDSGKVYWTALISGIPTNFYRELDLEPNEGHPARKGLIPPTRYVDWRYVNYEDGEDGSDISVVFYFFNQTLYLLKATAPQTGTTP